MPPAGTPGVGTDGTGGDPATRNGGGGTLSGADTDAGPFAAIASAMSALEGARPVLPLSLVATLVTTTGVVGAAMAFGMFGKRRRDGEHPTPTTSSPPLRPVASRSPMPMASPTSRRPMRPPPRSCSIPSWRCPAGAGRPCSKRAGPTRCATSGSAPRLTFDHGLVGALDGRERRLIGYNVVRLLDTPDELRGAEIGFLDQGDEVQLLEKRGVYWLVLCPDGRQGWIHKMTLGEVVGEPIQSSSPTATMPIAAETWTMGDDVDGDVLTAYLESRRRA